MQRILVKIHLFLLMGLAISLTFSFDWLRLTSLLVILIAVNSLLLFFFVKGAGHRRDAYFYLFLSLFLIHLLGLVLTENMVQGGHELEKKLSLLIFPLAFYFTPQIDEASVRKILSGFVWSCVLVVVACVLIAYWKFLSGRDVSVFYYHTLSEPLGMHAAYLSMYLCFAVAIQLHQRQLDTTTQKFWFYASLFILAAGIVLLAARAQILILALGSGIWLIAGLRKRYSWTKTTLISLSVPIGFMLIAMLFPVNRERFKAAINYQGQYSLSGEWGEQQMRTLIWTCAAELIKSKPLTGTGIGDGEDDLQLCYAAHDYISLTIFENTRFNAHNQYFETAIQLGLGGLLLYLASLLFPALSALRNGNILYIAFIAIFAASCMTESMLESQSGIIFFGFFNSFLFLNEARPGFGAQPGKNNSNV